MLRQVQISDAAQIAKIYNYYIENTKITFEEELLSQEVMKNRILDITENYPWIVFVDKETVIGYAYASRWKSRKAYDYSVEISVYVDNSYRGKGIGVTLYQKLIEELKKIKINSVIGGIALPNSASVRLHEKLGFEKVAEFPAVGYKFGEWLDVGYWQLNLAV